MTDPQSPGLDELADKIHAAMWRQSAGDAIAARLRVLTDELLVVRTAVIPIMPLDRAVFDPISRYLTSAHRSLEEASHLFDCWQQGIEQ